MKIIHTPDINIWREDSTCNRCSTKVEVEPSDIKHRTETKYTGDSDWSSGYQDDMFYAICPICKNELRLTDKHIPYLLKEKVKEDKKVKK